jgi:RNA polymerase sigma-70 factor (sigma-E family)
VSKADGELLDVIEAELARLQRLARSLTGNREAAEDLVAEAIVRTLPRWRAGTVDDPASYLRRVVVNLAAGRGRRRSLGQRRDRFALDWLTPAPELEAEAAERDRTWRAVMALPVRRRAVVVLRFYDDFSEARIAEVLGVAEGTVKSQLSRALEQLRGALGSLEEA